MSVTFDVVAEYNRLWDAHAMTAEHPTHSALRDLERRIRADEARECLKIARNEAGSWLSPTADDICIQIERRVNEHADQTLPSPIVAPKCPHGFRRPEYCGLCATEDKT